MFSDFLLQTVDVYKKTFQRNQYGQDLESWSLIISDLKCRFTKAKGESEVESLGKIPEINYKVFCEYNSNIDENCQLRDGNRKFNIKRVYKVYDSTGIHHLELLVTEIKR